jgi:isoquinoline 1-oxidoreductase beta subunit
MKLVVNDADVEVDDRHAKTPLLWVLREVIGLHGRPRVENTPQEGDRR